MSRRAGAQLLAALLSCCTFVCAPLAFADEAPAVQPPQHEAPILGGDGPMPTLYEKGDQTFSIDIGVLNPMFFYTTFGSTIENKVKIGGSGRLSYDYFITNRITIGGEFGGEFSSTVGENMLFIMPFGARVGYHFIYKAFEFPVTLMLGGATVSHLSKNYCGFIAKPSVGAFWRFSPEWSFGLNTAWWWLPQPTDTEPTVYGNFAEVTLAARYHF